MQSDGLDIIFVDYLNIMSVPGKFHSTADKLSAITGGMKAIAKDLDIPVVLLAQINRGAENIGGPRAGAGEPQGERQHRGGRRPYRLPPQAHS